MYISCGGPETGAELRLWLSSSGRIFTSWDPRRSTLLPRHEAWRGWGWAVPAAWFSSLASGLGHVRVGLREDGQGTGPQPRCQGIAVTKMMRGGVTDQPGRENSVSLAITILVKALEP